LTALYTGDLGGVKIRLNVDDASVTAPGAAALLVDRAYGWANFLDKKIVVAGGRIGDDLWGLGKLPINAFDPSLDGITGVRAEFKLVEGLSFGFGLPLDQITYLSVVPGTKTVGYFEDNTGKKHWESGFDLTKATYDTMEVSTQESVRAKANRTLSAVLGGAVIGGLYKSDFISVAAALRLNPAINSKDYGAAETTAGPNNKKGYYENPLWVEAVAGVSVKPIDPLIVVLDAQIDSRKYDDGDFAFGFYDETNERFLQKIGYTRIGLKGQYAVIPALTASLKFDLTLQNDGAEREKDDKITNYYNYDANDPSKNVTLVKINYARSVPVETYGDPSLGFEIGATYAVNAISAYLNIGSDNLLWIAGDVEYNKTDGTKWTYSPGAGIYVKPGVTITLGAATIEIFDKIDKIGASDLWYMYRDANNNVKDGTASPVTNQFQVDFNWKF
jgi:hypothetical protein